MTTSALGYCAFSNLRTAVKLFAAVLQIKEAKVIVVVKIVVTNVPVIILLVKAKTLTLSFAVLFHNSKQFLSYNIL